MSITDKTLKTVESTLADRMSPATASTADPSLTLAGDSPAPSSYNTSKTLGAHEDEALMSLTRQKSDTMEVSRMQSLARQLEFYFSKQNLFSDTYLQTLRGLNDGCVPVTILANFSKVKAILTPSGYERKPAALLLQEEEVRVHAILQAVSEHTELLRICSIDTTTGKITTDETPSSAITILAVGLATKELPSMPSVLSLAGLEESGSNTIILRDVNPSITEEEVKAVLEQIEDCPPVVCVARDVANCWFVTFRSRDRTDLVRVMMQLRTMAFPSTGEYILSRLKTSMTEIAVDVYNTYPCELTPLPPPTSTEKKKSKKKKKRGSKNKKKKYPTSPNGIPVVDETPTLPSFCEDQFPSLQNDKVEWEASALESNGMVGQGDVDVVQDEDDNSADNGSKEDEECEEPKSFKALSDVASTATTTSSILTASSNSEKQLVVPAYAAAVMKGIPKPVVPPSVRETSSSGSTSSSIGNEPETSTKELSPSPVLVDDQPVWGRARSFVAVVRHEQPFR